MEQPPQDLSSLLAAARDEQAGASERLSETLYRELHEIAAIQMRDERSEHTLQPTALVHEAYVRLLPEAKHASDRPDFLRRAARAMRQVLVDHARRRNAEKRGGGKVIHQPLVDQIVGADGQPFGLLDFDEALSQLSRTHPERATLAELLLLGGCSLPEISQTTGRSLATVKRDWALTKAWLQARL